MKKLKIFKYILETLIALPIIIVLYVLPIEKASICGAKIMRIILLLNLKCIKTAKSNLKAAMPLKTDKEIDLIVERMIEHFGRMIGEMFHWHRMDIQQIKKRVKIEGKLKEEKKAKIIISAHIGNFEPIPYFISKIINSELAFVYRPFNNFFIDFIFMNIRKKSNAAPVKKGVNGIKKVLHCLKNNISVGMLVDQKSGTGKNIKFMHKDAKTTTMPAAMALKCKSPIVLVRCIRTNGVNYKFTIDPPLQINKDDDDISITRKINMRFEQWIFENPEQWFWLHNRWKK